MKKLLFISIFLTFVLLINAQEKGFNYKALITEDGTALANRSTDVRFTILENGTSIVYQEEQNTTTDENGIIILNIGEGTPVSGNFTTIDWANEQFLQVEINTGSGCELRNNRL